MERQLQKRMDKEKEAEILEWFAGIGISMNLRLLGWESL